MGARDKVAANAAAAVADIPDGARLLLGGFGVIQSWPISLITALHDRGVRDLTIICNTPGVGPTSLHLNFQKDQPDRLIPYMPIIGFGSRLSVTGPR